MDHQWTVSTDHELSYYVVSYRNYLHIMTCDWLRLETVKIKIKLHFYKHFITLNLKKKKKMTSKQKLK